MHGNGSLPCTARGRVTHYISDIGAILRYIHEIRVEHAVTSQQP